MQRIWLIFAQSVTACLGVLFVLRLFYPSLLNDIAETTPAVVIQETQTQLTAAATTIPISTYSDAAKKAMPAVVNIFTSSKTVGNQYQRFMDDPLFKHFFGDKLNKKKKP